MASVKECKRGWEIPWEWDNQWEAFAEEECQWENRRMLISLIRKWILIGRNVITKK